MLNSFLAGGSLRFLMKFIPSSFELIIKSILEYKMQKLSIEHSKYLLEKHKIDAETQSHIADVKAEIAEIKASKNIKIIKTQAQYAKSGIRWIDGCTVLFRIIASFFWLIVFPISIVYYNGPSLLFTEVAFEISLAITGFWFADNAYKPRKANTE